jgi:molybdate transport system substrate-binding protein
MHAVVFPEPGATPTGKHLVAAFEKMGIAEAMQAKTVFRNAIDGGVTLVRDGKVDLGLFLVTEILPVKGVKLVGTLPPSMQGYVVYAAGVVGDSKAYDAAQQFLEFLTKPDARKHWEAAGFEPRSGN